MRDSTELVEMLEEIEELSDDGKYRVTIPVALHKRVSAALDRSLKRTIDDLIGPHAAHARGKLGAI